MNNKTKQKKVRLKFRKTKGDVMTAERLYRKRINRVFGGVAAGLGDYLNLDPVLVRVLFIILAFVNGIGLLLYIILWIVIPEDTTIFTYPPKNSEAKKETTTESSDTFESENVEEEEKKYEPNFTIPSQAKGNGRMIFGSILIGIGIIFLAERFIPIFDFFDFLPVILIVLGIILITNAKQKGN